MRAAPLRNVPIRPAGPLTVPSGICANTAPLRVTARAASTCCSTPSPPRHTGSSPPSRWMRTSRQRAVNVDGALPRNQARGSSGRAWITRNGSIQPRWAAADRAGSRPSRGRRSWPLVAIRNRNSPNRMNRPTSRSTRYRIEAFASGSRPSHTSPSRAPPATGRGHRLGREPGWRRTPAGCCSRRAVRCGRGVRRGIRSRVRVGRHRRLRRDPRARRRRHRHRPPVRRRRRRQRRLRRRRRVRLPRRRPPRRSSSSSSSLVDRRVLARRRRVAPALDARARPVPDREHDDRERDRRSPTRPSRSGPRRTSSCRPAASRAASARRRTRPGTAGTGHPDAAVRPIDARSTAA